MSNFARCTSSCSRTWLDPDLSTLPSDPEIGYTTSMNAAPQRLLCLVALFLCAGCGAALMAGVPRNPPDSALSIRETASYRCIHGTPGANSPFREPLPGPVTDPELLPHLARFDPRVRRTAVAAGLEPLLARTMAERDSATDPHHNDLLALRQELAQRIGSLETQLMAMEFECDCVRSLLMSTLNDYEEGETDRQLAYTIASLVVGTVTSIVAASWDLANSGAVEPFAEDAPLYISIGGAVVTTALGVAVLIRQRRPVVYTHAHNILGPIVAGADPDFLYPTFLFNLLTLPPVGGGPTPRDELVESWTERLDDAIPADDRRTVESIVYGVGGIYDPNLLALHQEFLQSLGAALDSFARDIDLLSRAIGIALAVDFDAAPANVHAHSAADGARREDSAQYGDQRAEPSRTPPVDAHSH